MWSFNICFFKTHSCTVFKATKNRKKELIYQRPQVMGTKLTSSLNIFFYYDINILKSMVKGRCKKVTFWNKKVRNASGDFIKIVCLPQVQFWNKSTWQQTITTEVPHLK